MTMRWESLFKVKSDPVRVMVHTKEFSEDLSGNVPLKARLQRVTKEFLVR